MMRIFKRISEYFSSPSSVDNAGYWVFVRFKKCGEALKTRVDLDHDLSVDYDGEGDQSYLIRKQWLAAQVAFNGLKLN